MGWDYTVGLNDLPTEVNRALAGAGAKAASMTTPVEALLRARAEGRDNDLLEYWFVGTAHGGAHEGKEYIGLLLFDADTDAKSKLLPYAEELYFDLLNDRTFSKHSRFVQCWGYKALSAEMIPSYYNCPLEYLDKVPSSGEKEDAWRAEVRRRAGA